MYTACASLHLVRVLPRVGLHQCPSEKIRPREPACGRPILSHVSTTAQSPAKARDFSRAASLSTGETDSPLEEPGFEPLVPLCGVVVSGGNRNAGIGEEDDLEGVVCRGDRAFESHLLQQSDCTTLRHRLAPRTVLSLIDAAGPWRDWQPEAGKGGHPTQSPRFRLWARLEAERTPKQSRPKSKFLGSIHELFARGKPR